MNEVPDEGSSVFSQSNEVRNQFSVCPFRSVQSKILVCSVIILTNYRSYTAQRVLISHAK